MTKILLLQALGSLIIAFAIVLQVKYVGSNILDIAKYNLCITPFMLIANIAIGASVVFGHKVVKNVALLIAFQTFIYYIFLAILSVIILHDKITIPRTILAFSLITLGIWILRK